MFCRRREGRLFHGPSTDAGARRIVVFFVGREGIFANCDRERQNRGKNGVSERRRASDSGENRGAVDFAKGGASATILELRGAALLQHRFFRAGGRPRPCAGYRATFAVSQVISLLKPGQNAGGFLTRLDRASTETRPTARIVSRRRDSSHDSTARVLKQKITGAGMGQIWGWQQSPRHFTQFVAG